MKELHALAARAWLRETAGKGRVEVEIRRPGYVDVRVSIGVRRVDLFVPLTSIVVAGEATGAHLVRACTTALGGEAALLAQIYGPPIGTA